LERVKQLISYFLANSPYPLYKTQIVKMLYLFEYYHVQTYGKQYTDLDFIRWNYGPYAHKIESELNELIFCGLVKKETIIGAFGRSEVYLHKPNDINIVTQFPLDADRRYIADRVILELSCKSYEDMISIVYSTPPMEKILKEEERVGTKLYGRRVDMKESKPLRKFSKAKIEEARKRLDKSSRGSDEEYYAHLLAVNEELKTLRRRANSCILK
jgi:hypothetical protein